MKFGVTVVPRVSDWKLFVDLEAMGYDAAWAADSQMLYSDAYATLALAAVNTSRIRLGTGVSVAGVRLAPVTAHVSLPSDLVYFSFTTLTTLGYGDIMPVHPIARSLSNIEAIIGQVYPATLLARLVSLGGEQARS